MTILSALNLLSLSHLRLQSSLIQVHLCYRLENHLYMLLITISRVLEFLTSSLPISVSHQRRCEEKCCCAVNMSNCVYILCHSVPMHFILCTMWKLSLYIKVQLDFYKWILISVKLDLVYTLCSALQVLKGINSCRVSVVITFSGQRIIIKIASHSLTLSWQ